MNHALNSAMHEVEIPPFKPDVIDRALNGGRRRMRIRRAAGAGVGVVAISSVIAFAHLSGWDSSTDLVASDTVAESPTPSQAMPVLDTGITVSGSSAVLRLLTTGNETTLAVGLDGRVAPGADGLTPTALESTVTAPRGWTTAAVVDYPDLSTTGEVIVFGYLTEHTDVRVLIDGVPVSSEDASRGAGQSNAVVGYGGILGFSPDQPGVPLEWTTAPPGPYLFAVAVDVPNVHGLDAHDPSIPSALRVQGSSDGESWTDIASR